MEPQAVKAMLELEAVPEHKAVLEQEAVLEFEVALEEEAALVVQLDKALSLEVDAQQVDRAQSS